MPIPTPYSEESKSTYIERCIAFVSVENGDLTTDRASAICYAQWRQSKKRTVIKPDGSDGVEKPTPDPDVPSLDTPPQWIRYSLLLRKLLREAWLESSSGWANELLAKIQEVDVDGAREVLQGIAPLRKRFKKSLGDRVGILVDLAFKKSNGYWKKYAKEYLANAPKEKADTSTHVTKAVQTPDDEYQERIRALHAEQIEKFALAYPERILAPEIERLIDLMADYETARELDIAYIAERANRMLAAESYWEGLSDTHIARLWHSDGIAHAKANQVGRMQIVAILDEVTCPVCLTMHGQEVEVKKAGEKIEKDLDIEDLTEYVKAWKFPRFNEIQLMTNEEITSGVYLVPFHPRCRCMQRWLY